MIIVGIGSSAKEIISFFRNETDRKRIVFFLEPKYSSNLKSIGGYKIINSYDEIKEYIQNIDAKFIVAIQHGRTRERVVNKLENMGGKYISLISEKSIVSHLNVNIDQAIIHPLTIIAHNVSIGKGVIIEPRCLIAHDIAIEQYVFLGPESGIGPYCRIGKYSSIGARVMIDEGLNIGRNAAIGTGSKVFRNVDDYEVFVNDRNI